MCVWAFDPSIASMLMVFVCAQRLKRIHAHSPDVHSRPSDPCFVCLPQQLVRASGRGAGRRSRPRSSCRPALRTSASAPKRPATEVMARLPSMSPWAREPRLHHERVNSGLGSGASQRMYKLRLWGRARQLHDQILSCLNPFVEWACPVPPWVYSLSPSVNCDRLAGTSTSCPSLHIVV